MMELGLTVVAEAAAASSRRGPLAGAGATQMPVSNTVRSNPSANSDGAAQHRTSKYTGVHFSTSKKRWLSEVASSGKKWYVGSFTSELAAAAATDLFRLGISGGSGARDISLNLPLEEYGKDADLAIAKGRQGPKNPARIIPFVREIVKRRLPPTTAMQGYYWDKKQGAYIVQMSWNEETQIGAFKKESEAMRAFDLFSLCVLGCDSPLNRPKETYTQEAGKFKGIDKHFLIKYLAGSDSKWLFESAEQGAGAKPENCHDSNSEDTNQLPKRRKIEPPSGNEGDNEEVCDQNQPEKHESMEDQGQDGAEDQNMAAKNVGPGKHRAKDTSSTQCTMDKQQSGTAREWDEMVRFLVETVEDKALLPFLSRVYLAKVSVRVQSDLMTHYKFVKLAPAATQGTWMTEILKVMASDESTQ